MTWPLKIQLKSSIATIKTVKKSVTALDYLTNMHRPKCSHTPLYLHFWPARASGWKLLPAPFNKVADNSCLRPAQYFMTATNKNSCRNNAETADQELISPFY